MPAESIERFLRGAKVDYATITHPRSEAAAATAELAHVRERQLAKTVMVLIDGRLAMVVVPADHRVDLDRLGRWAGMAGVRIASERDFVDRFPGCERGATPPFGNLYGLPVYVSDTLARERRVACNAGLCSELIVMDYADFARLVNPIVAPISRPVPTLWD